MNLEKISISGSRAQKPERPGFPAISRCVSYNIYNSITTTWLAANLGPARSPKCRVKDKKYLKSKFSTGIKKTGNPKMVVVVVCSSSSRRRRRHRRRRSRRRSSRRRLSSSSGSRSRSSRSSSRSSSSSSSRSSRGGGGGNSRGRAQRFLLIEGSGCHAGRRRRWALSSTFVAASTHRR